ncbi:hypothetical protein D9758_008090 [Tetrapyrgos nigripes]|uniref:Glutamine synthetase n=1 Tax=Tetrapyrgos nigripes TaxID=182062 RepID=A0A8H5GHC7_9AGAR|nr:hypothetical protein D9758_008090 [Tetrapyrgos nigripes]
MAPRPTTDFSHGVHYTPGNVAKPKALSPEGLRYSGITYIRFQWVDLANNVRYRVIPVSYFEKLLLSPRPGVAMTKASLGIIYLNMAEGFSPIGEYLYIADLDSLRACPYEPGHATIMGYFQEKAPLEGVRIDVDLCPRTMLKRVEEDAASQSVQFLVGIETEFILLKATSPVPVASNVHNWSHSEGLRTGSVESKILREISDALLETKVEVQMYHAEAAPGQYEIVTGPLTPLAAADAAILTRETIANIAAKHGLRATFAPRVYMDSCGSSTHTHVSVHSTSQNGSSSSSTDADGHDLTTAEASFLSNLLEHLPSIALLTLPIPASYKRVQDGVWSGGTYVCWGTENREAPIRLTNAHSKTSRNFELRFIDGTSNPYLALTAVLGMGLEGIKRKSKLETKDCSYEMSKGVWNTKTPAQMSEQERKQLGITKRFPLTWEEAREKFGSDEMVRKVFGEEFVKKYLSVNKVLAESLAQDKDEAKELTRLVEYY